MLVPVKWLEEYTDVNVSVDEFCDRMIMSGSNLETVEYFGQGIENVVVGKILSIEKHPDADKLVITQIDTGASEPVQIVTGAANISVGDYVPVALHGSRIPGPLHGQPKQPGGVTIKKGKLRGVESNGMLCSCSELGFEDKVVPVVHRDGIWILDREYPAGTDIVKALELECAVVDFEITPNRPDCLSMIGMAREAAATFGTELRYPDTKCEEKGAEKTKDFISVEIRKPEYCRRYVARVVKDIKIEQSPWWLQKCLIFAGMRPINNIVDITNYVMLEYGQPLHAFDIRTVSGNQIIVDTAQEGETFTTLDGTERTMTGDALMIKDAEKAIGIAGIMGGLNSEIEEDTTMILVEGANFNGDNVRATSKRLGLRTEASARFEKGIDPNLTVQAVDRVCRLIEILNAGTVLRGTVDVYPKEYRAESVKVRAERVNAMLGVELSAKEMEEIFESLEMKVSRLGNTMNVTPPTVRQDLLTEVDFVEEVARMYGYDKLPVTLPRSNDEAKKSRKQRLRDMAKDALLGLGMNEIQTYSFVSPKGLDNIRMADDAEGRKLIKLINPLGEDTSVMRTTLIPNMLEVFGRNYSRNTLAMRAFELGNTFINNHHLEDPLPEEKDMLCAACYGEQESFFTLKGILNEMLYKLGIRELCFCPEENVGTFHPGRCAKIFAGDRELGIIGEIHPDVAEKYGIGTRVLCAELDFDELCQLADTEKLYSPLPKYPSIKRDIAMVVKEEIMVAQLEAVIKKEGKKLLESVALFDVYRGKPILPGSKSVAFTLVYRAQDHTLTDEEVSKVHDRVLSGLRDEYGAQLREM